MIEIELRWSQIIRASITGIWRNVQCKQKGWEDTDGFDGPGWNEHIEGACGEMAVAKFLKEFWEGEVGDLSAIDVAGFQVKTNISRQWDDLIVRKRDKDGIYISVLSFTPVYRIQGWLPSNEIKLDEYWRDGKKGRFAWFVPRTKLRPMSELPRRG